MGIKRYSRYCGPAVMSTALGISPVDAAHALKSAAYFTEGRRRVVTLTAATWLTYAMRKRGVTAMHTKYYGASRRVTLRRWIREHAAGRQFVRTTTHWHYLVDGHVVESQGSTDWNGYVQDVIDLGRVAS